MSNGKTQALIIVSLVLGASGLGIGTFVMVYELETTGPEGPEGPQGPPGINGTDGEDGLNGTDVPNTYYCSSQQEIEDALITIGTGTGHILITEDITLYSTIYINGGGSYIIEGVGEITLSLNINDETFVITDVESMVLRNMNIDTSSISAPSIQGINITEHDNNLVRIENVRIQGGIARGIYINSENVWIENCIITNMYEGIVMDSGSGNCHVIENTISQLRTNDWDAYAIHLIESSFNILSGNIIYDLDSVEGDTGWMYGIYLEGLSQSNIISNNILCDFYSAGGFVWVLWCTTSASYNSISDNTMYDIYTGYNVVGINIEGNDTSITGNILCITAFNPSNCYGIQITASGSYNVITGNIVDVMSLPNGIIDSGTNNIIGNNVIH
ncbi:MAG: right-handed parallel beta-helix repeat-containing protein [Candidatus Lokiarchaeota archaeon]|nr:right-handed parallel beta-helix repeat-containing protein [Candidatus Lokiarchaeota archaeon]